MPSIAAPSMDGQILLYPYTGRAAPSPKAFEPLIYVNGMNTSPVQHADTARGFAALTRHDVLGCYNLEGNYATYLVARVTAKLRLEIQAARARLRGVSSGFDAASDALFSASRTMAPVAPWLAGDTAAAAVAVKTVSPDTLLSLLDGVVAAAQLGGEKLQFMADLEQCADDWMTPLQFDALRKLPAMLETAMPLQFVLLNRLSQVLLTPKSARSAARFGFAVALLSDNDASESLFRFLFDLQANGKLIHIICHSQGNLIVSNVLNMLNWVLGASLRASIHVFGLASPANPSAWPSMPGRLRLNLYYNVNDPVALLSLRGDGPARPDTVELHEVVINQKTDSFGLQNHDIGRYEAESPVDADLRREFQVPR